MAGRSSQKWRVIREGKLVFQKTRKRNKMSGSKIESCGTVQLLIQTSSENPNWEWDPETKYWLKFNDLEFDSTVQASLYVYVSHTSFDQKHMLTGLWQNHADRVLFHDNLGGSINKGRSSSGAGAIMQELRVPEASRLVSVVVAKPAGTAPVSMRAAVAARAALRAVGPGEPAAQPPILLDVGDPRWRALRARAGELSLRAKKVKAMKMAQGLARAKYQADLAAFEKAQKDAQKKQKKKKGNKRAAAAAGAPHGGAAAAAEAPAPPGDGFLPAPAARAACRAAFARRGISKGGLLDFATMERVAAYTLGLPVLQPRLRRVLAQVSQRCGYTECKLDFRTYSLCISAISSMIDELQSPTHITLLDAFQHLDVDLSGKMEDLEFLAALESMGYRYDEGELRALQAHFSTRAAATGQQMTLEHFMACFIEMCDYERELKLRGIKKRTVLSSSEKAIRAVHEKLLGGAMAEEHAAVDAAVARAGAAIGALLQREEGANDAGPPGAGEDVHREEGGEGEGEGGGEEDGRRTAAFEVRLAAARGLREERERRRREAAAAARAGAEERGLRARAAAGARARRALADAAAGRRRRDRRGVAAALRERCGVDRLDLAGHALHAVDEPLLRRRAGPAGLGDLKDLSLARNALRALPEELLYHLFAVQKFDCSKNQLSNITNIGNMKDLLILNLQSNLIREIPEELGELAGLRRLDLSRNRLRALPPALGRLTRLEALTLHGNEISEVAEHVFNHLSNLTVLELQRNCLKVLPDDFLDMPNLTTLDLSHNSLQFLPPSLSCLESLKVLRAGSNGLEALRGGAWWGALRGLEYLHLEANRLRRLPPDVGRLENLRHLDLARNLLTSLPDAPGCLAGLAGLRYFSAAENRLTSVSPEIGRCYALEILDVAGNEIESLPMELSGLGSLRRLLAARNRLTGLPEELGLAYGLEVLGLARNQIAALPAAVPRLANLKVLDLSNNALTELPYDICRLRKLVRLDLTQNLLEALPESLGDMPRLRELLAGGNRVGALPGALARARSLRTLDLHSNRLAAWPRALFALTALQTLHLLRNPLTQRDYKVVCQEQNWPEMVRTHRYYPFAVQEWEENQDAYDSGRMRMPDFLFRVEERMNSPKGLLSSATLKQPSQRSRATAGSQAWEEEATSTWSPYRRKSKEVAEAESGESEDIEALVGFFFVQAHTTRRSPTFDLMCRQTMTQLGRSGFSRATTAPAAGSSSGQRRPSLFGEQQGNDWQHLFVNDQVAGFMPSTTSAGDDYSEGQASNRYLLPNTNETTNPLVPPLSPLVAVRHHPKGSGGGLSAATPQQPGLLHRPSTAVGGGPISTISPIRQENKQENGDNFSMVVAAAV